MQPRGNCRFLRGRGVDGIVCHFIGFARGCRSSAAALGVDVEGRWGDGAEGWTLRSPRDRSVPFALGCRRDWKALTRYKVSIARSVGGQRKRRCVLVEWLHGLRDGYALDKGIGRFLYKGFLCPLSKIPGLPLRVVCLFVCLSVVWAFLCGLFVCLFVCLSCGPSSAGCLLVCLSVVWAFLCGLFACLSVCRVGLPLRVVCLSVCLSCGPSSAGCLLVCLSVVWAFLCGLFACLSVCRVGLPLRVVCLSVCLSCGHLSGLVVSVVWAFFSGRVVVVGAFLSGLFICVPVVWASLRARCCGPVGLFSGRVVVVGAFLSGLFICVPVVWASLRARCCGPVGGPSFSRALVSGLVTMSSIAMNRMGLKLVLFVSLLDSDRACCYPGCPL